MPDLKPLLVILLPTTPLLKPRVTINPSTRNINHQIHRCQRCQEVEKRIQMSLVKRLSGRCPFVRFRLIRRRIYGIGQRLGRGCGGG
ncbi:hypothetical protein CDL12_29958 [Handroanthus impetiginosus]|uniref:Uncharacterized protein n=1 Tax=Handroanthus impetiginosus TaxID=429701 RepID=A0A2G9FXB4_9LAMI|nr:hypothetical protein CDL12_29958 [Handroanthus impetiginosus]